MMANHYTREVVRSEDHAKAMAEVWEWDFVRILTDLEDDQGLMALFYTRPHGYSLAEEQAMERCLND